MLFDLFACIDFSDNEINCVNPFTGLDPYKKLMFAEQEVSMRHAYLVSLHKRHDDNFQVHQDSNLEIRIFGYCFPRTNSQLIKDKTKLSANRISQIYKELGKDFMTEIKGSFAIFIWDKKNNTFQVFTDPLNVRPVYYYHEGTTLVISTTLAAISSHMKSNKEETTLNYPAIIEYYLFEYVLNDDTYIENVYTIPPGGLLRFDKKGLQVDQYWKISEEISDFTIEHTDEERALDKLENILKKNLSLYLSDPDRTAIALTGGYDSRTNLALLGNRSKDYLFYSYGTEGNYDLSIPKKIAKSLNLRFKAICLDEQYYKNYNKNAELAIGLGDGIAEANRGNYLYAFKELGKSYDYILTGLFGSELIKHPTSVGNFINQDMKDILEGESPENLIDKILDKAEKQNFIDKKIFQQHRETVKKRVLGNPYIINDHNLPIKYFYFLLIIGIRKYFMKEIKVERPFVENLHPFFDIEFIKVLLKTPFPWIHHWEGKKNLIKGLTTHKFYVSLMKRNNSKLVDIISTHGYTPKYLLNSFFVPYMTLEYMYYKKRIRAKGSFHSAEPVWNYFKQIDTLNGDGSFINELKPQENEDNKNTIKLNSLKHWLVKNKLI